MKFEEALSAIKAGKRVRRSGWSDDPEKYMALYEDALIDQRDGSIFLFLSDVEADDWEIVKETKKVKLRDLTKKQYKYFCRRFNDPNDLYGNNGHYFDGTACNTCPCTNVICGLTLDNCRFYHKDLYSDKFLDQEVETYDDDDLPREIEDYH